MRLPAFLFLGIEWHSHDPGRIEKYSDQLLALIEEYKAPLHWIIPSHPFLETSRGEFDKLITEIKLRKDFLISGGYTQAPLPLLTEDEWEKEILWSLTNPWKSGLEDVFGRPPVAFSPGAFLPSIEGIKLLLDKKNLPAMLKNPGDPAQGIPRYQMLPFPGEKPLNKMLKKEQALFLNFRIEDTTTPESLARSWDGLKKTVNPLLSKKLLSWASLEDHPPTPGEIKHPANLFNSIENRKRLLESAPFRKSRGDKEIKESLIRLSEIRVPSHSQKEVPSFPPEDRLSTYSMQGEALLTGEEFSILFNEGRFNNIVKENSFLPGFPLESYICVNQKKLDFRNISSFSIGGEFTRGLRELAQVEGEGILQPGAFLRDYIYMDEFPFLVVSTRLKYPGLDSRYTMEAIAPFEVPLILMDKKKPLTLHTLTGTHKGTYTLFSDSPPLTLGGTLIGVPVKEEWFILGFPELENRETGAFELMIRKIKRKKVLSLNITGTYHPEGDYNNKTEFLSFYMGIVKEFPQTPPSIPEKRIKEIPPGSIATPMEHHHE